MKNSKSETIKYAFKASIPIMAGYIVLGMGFGVLMESKGYGWWWSLLMSLTVYAGSMQYVAIDLLAGGANLISAALMTLLVNIRHIFYGITMLEGYKDTGAKKPYLICALTDETFSLVCSPKLPEGVERKAYYFFVSLFNHFYWVAGSVLGGVIGNVFTFNTAGVDFAMTALFVVIFVEQWESTKQHLPALTGVLCSLVMLLIFGPSDFLIPSMITITVALLVERKMLEGGGEE